MPAHHDGGQRPRGGDGRPRSRTARVRQELGDHQPRRRKAYQRKRTKRHCVRRGHDGDYKLAEGRSTRSSSARSARVRSTVSERGASSRPTCRADSIESSGGCGPGGRDRPVRRGAPRHRRPPSPQGERTIRQVGLSPRCRFVPTL
jgi:hypothetical protein